jgi:hypothetical protein
MMRRDVGGPARCWKHQARPGSIRGLNPHAICWEPTPMMGLGEMYVKTPHVHPRRCLSPVCQDRQWACTQPMCAQHVAYNHCAVCYPDGPMRPAQTRALAWSVWT